MRGKMFTCTYTHKLLKFNFLLVITKSNFNFLFSSNSAWDLNKKFSQIQKKNFENLLAFKFHWNLMRVDIIGTCVFVCGNVIKNVYISLHQFALLFSNFNMNFSGKQSEFQNLRGKIKKNPLKKIKKFRKK